MDVLVAVLKAIGMISGVLALTGLICFGGYRNPIVTLVLIILVLIIITAILFYEGALWKIVKYLKEIYVLGCTGLGEEGWCGPEQCPIYEKYKNLSGIELCKKIIEGIQTKLWIK